MRPNFTSLFLFSKPNNLGFHHHPQSNSKSQLHEHVQSRRDTITSLTTTSLIFTSTLSRAENSYAITSSEAETSYNQYAKTYDDLDGGYIADSLGIEESRIKLIKQARGNVLEVAVGTGLNLNKYK